MIDIDGMVGRLVKLVQNAHLATTLGSSREHSITEMLFGDHLRTTERKKYSTLLDAFQGDTVQSGIAF